MRISLEGIQSEWANQTLINYLAANFIRTFGPDGWRKKWAEIALCRVTPYEVQYCGKLV